MGRQVRRIVFTAKTALGRVYGGMLARTKWTRIAAKYVLHRRALSNRTISSGNSSNACLAAGRIRPRFVVEPSANGRQLTDAARFALTAP